MGHRYDAVCDGLINQPRRWLVTGVAGFIGSALLERLLDLGQTVVGIDNFSNGSQANLDDVLAIHPDLKAQFDFVEGDIRDPATCARVCKDIDYVLHQAAIGSVPRSIKDPEPYHATNVTGFLNMLLAARAAKVSRFVYASSSSVYGDHPGLPKHEEAIGKPLSPYAATKRMNELYGEVFADVYGMQIVGLRYFNVFGRRQDPNGLYAAVIPRWIGNLMHGKPCVIFGDGSNSRDFCYVDNAVQANLLSACSPVDRLRSPVYNVGCNGRTDLKQLFTIIRDNLAALQPENPGITEVATAEAVFEAPRPGDIPHSQASIEKLSHDLGYEPSHEIAAGLAETVKWLAEHPERMAH
ncbi:MAG: SDR family oxidoreductase [Kofleriaceae bacterium]|nr:MAG: SDR family oxidoreductase [Kofleriaceae bacterium]